MKTALRELRPTLSLALPIVVGQVSQMLMGVTDSVMIGRAGAVPLAASAFGGTVFNMFYVVGIGLMIPVSIFVARARGANSPAEAGEYLRHGMLVAVGFGAIETVIMGVIGTQLRHFDQPPEVLAVVLPFFLLIAASLIPVLMYLALRQFAEAMGRPWLPMVVILASVALNAALNWVLIYGNLGCPPLGLTGAGISTLIARVAGGLAICLWLRRDPAVRAAWPTRWWGGFSRARLVEMLKLGLPASGMLLFETTAFGFSCVMIGWLGTVPLAAHQIAITSASLAFMIPLGLSMAAGMRVSHAIGAGELARRRPIAFGAIGFGVAAMGIFGVVFWFAGRQIAAWFVTEAAVIAVAAQLFGVAALFQIADGAQVIGAASLRAIGDVKLPTLITFAAYWVVALPLGYALGVRGTLGAAGMWIGIASGLTLAAGLLAWRFARLTRT